MNTKKQDIITCSSCNKTWESIDSFLHDEQLLFAGYQPDFNSPEYGGFLFIHNTEGCGTTLSIDVKKFKSLLGREVDFLPFQPAKEHDCERRCIVESDLSPCASKNCPGTIVRELMQIVKQHVKTPIETLSADEIDKIINQGTM